MDLLVACEQLTLNGGLMRFERVGECIAIKGHSLTFVTMRNDIAPDWKSHFPVLSPMDASKRVWDATMVPGAGFDPRTIEKFSIFRDKRYGVRVQHILSDRTRKKHFQHVNRCFAPNMIVFNNDAWPAGSFADFSAATYHVLIGGVDCQRFSPPADRTERRNKERFVVGGLATKARPLIDTLRLLPDKVCVCLFGYAASLAEEYPNEIRAGRLILAGPMFDHDLVSYYRSLDAFVTADLVAGWCNPAAEALAVGLPLICTPHGVSSFAVDGVTALIMAEQSPSAIAQRLEWIIANGDSAEMLGRRGRQKILDFDWDRYSDRLVHLLEEELGSAITNEDARPL